MALVNYVEAKMVEGGVLPAEGLATFTDNGPAGVSVAYPLTFTQAQINAAEAFRATIDMTPATVSAWEAQQEAERNPDFAALISDAEAAVATNNTFIALATPTNAQTLAEVKALARQNNRIIAALLKVIFAVKN